MTKLIVSRNFFDYGDDARWMYRPDNAPVKRASYTHSPRIRVHAAVRRRATEEAGFGCSTVLEADRVEVLESEVPPAEGAEAVYFSFDSFFRKSDHSRVTSFEVFDLMPNGSMWMSKAATTPSCVIEAPAAAPGEVTPIMIDEDEDEDWDDDDDDDEDEDEDDDDDDNDDMDELTGRIKDWAKVRQIIPNSSTLAQSRKTIEEVHEFIEAAAKLDVLLEVSTLIDRKHKDKFQEIWKRSREELKDGIGDVFVTLVSSAALSGMEMRSCILHAYKRIKNRTGTLRPDGVFVRD